VRLPVVKLGRREGGQSRIDLVSCHCSIGIAPFVVGPMSVIFVTPA
jgi:hypothetical protein